MAKDQIDSDLVRQLAELLEETGLSEIEYGTGTWRIRVARGTPPVVAAAGPPQAPAPGPTMAEPVEPAMRPGTVTSPMVGTVYLAPEPGAANFVKLGDRVDEGQTLLLIEAMKTFNEIRAPHAGEVSAILVEDRTPVEYGDALMVVK